MKWISIVRTAGVVLSVSFLVAEAQAGPFAVHARELVTAEDGVVVHGSIGVHATGGAPYRITLGAVKVDGDRTIAGSSVKLGKGSVVGAIDTDVLSAAGAQHGAVAPMVPVDDIAGPVPFAPRNGQLEIAQHTTLTLAPGQYGTVVLEGGSTLLLTGGLYEFASLRAATQPALTASSPRMSSAGTVSATRGS